MSNRFGEEDQEQERSRNERLFVEWEIWDRIVWALKESKPNLLDLAGICTE
jgi:hypothetical protein